MNTTTLGKKVIQYDFHFIMSIRSSVSNRLPINIYNKVISYQKFKTKKNKNINKFLLSRNPESLNIEEVKIQVKKEMHGMLNRLTLTNLDIMIEKIGGLLDIINKVQNKTNIYEIIMSMLLTKATKESGYSELYAKILEVMRKRINLDYCEFLDNLFVNMKKDTAKIFSKDYNIFCNQLADKSQYIGLFKFLGTLYNLKLMEMVLIKKYIMVLLNNITSDKLTELEMETNAECIKQLLIICNNNNFYDVVYNKFIVMKNNRVKYKPKFRFILIDIVENYDKKLKKIKKIEL